MVPLPAIAPAPALLAAPTAVHLPVFFYRVLSCLFSLCLTIKSMSVRNLCLIDHVFQHRRNVVLYRRERRATDHPLAGCRGRSRQLCTLEACVSLRTLRRANAFGSSLGSPWTHAMRHHRTRAFLCLLAACIVLGCRATAIDSRAQRGSGDPAVWRGGRSGRGLQQAAPTPPPGSLTGPQTNCTLPLGANSLRFAACTPINGIGTNFALLWSLHIHPNGTCTIVLGLRAAAGGWSAVGFPTTPGHMLGSTAMVLSTCPTCASGG